MMVKPDFHYYLITDRKACAPRLLEEVIKEACAAGIRAVQLREKDLSGRSLFELASNIRQVTSRYDSKLFINGRPDIAQAVDADGVHCREKGLDPASINKYWSDLAVGASVHSLKAARKAQQQGADFLLFGPVYFTPSKASYGKPQGIDKLRKTAEQSAIPVYAVGGVTADRVKECRVAGAYGTAGISAVMKAEDTMKKVKEFT